MTNETAPIPTAEMFPVATRITLSDVMMPRLLNDVSFDRHIFKTVSCKGGVFKGVQFKYVIFEDCYFRDCKFEKCNFTGAVLRNSNFRGSAFDGCDFSYCRLSNTIVHESIIRRNMPGYENVALQLARALRVNYAQLGDSEGVNAAILAELQATRTHLHKAAFSRESYYRTKYCGTARVGSVGKYTWFVITDFAWGHGESLFKLLRLLVLFYIAVVGWGLLQGRPFTEIFIEAYSLLWGTYKGVDCSPLFFGTVTAVRLLLTGLFVAVLVRRFSKR